jgi:hypothetical protein
MVSQTEIKYCMYIKNSIYFAILVHRQEYRNETMNRLFHTPDETLVVRNILSLIYNILSQFVKPPNDTPPSLFQHVSRSAITIFPTIHRIQVKSIIRELLFFLDFFYFLLLTISFSPEVPNYFRFAVP